MALALADRVNETTTTTGTGTVTLAGAVSGYQSFTVIGNGNTTYYTIVHQTLSEWEVGIGTYTASGTTLSRDTILASSNGGSAVNFSAGTKFVFCDYPAGRAVYLDSSTNVTVPQITLSSGTANGVLYLNGSKVATSGSTLVFDGSRLGVGVTPSEVIDANGAILSRSNLIAYTALVLQRSSSSLELPVAAYTNGSGNILSAGTKGDIVAFGNVGGDGVIFANSNTEQMRLTSTGLGIGTSSPAVPLDVVSNSGSNGINIRVRSSNDYGFLNFKSYDGSDTAGSIAALRSGVNAGSLLFYTGTTEKMRLDSSGNLGLGVTPSAWSGFKAFQISRGSFTSFTTSTYLSHNWYYDGVNDKYIASDYATRYLQENGKHIWYIAPSGTAGNAISFTQALTLDANVNLLLNGTTAPASGVGTFAIFNGTAPTGSVTNGCVLYTEDVSSSSELKVRDEAGNVTTLSPHNFSLIPEGASEDMAWAYYSEKGGKRINVDMLKLARMVEKLTGEKLVYEA